MKACPDCGTVAVETERKILGRRVYGCGNRECGLDFYQLNGRIVRYRPIRWEPYPNSLVVLYASILSKNGALGTAYIVGTPDGGFQLKAYSETNGKPWKSPGEIYPSVEDAKAAAEKLWRGV